jgi:hypothetical protein
MSSPRLGRYNVRKTKCNNDIVYKINESQINTFLRNNIHKKCFNVYFNNNLKYESIATFINYNGRLYLSSIDKELNNVNIILFGHLKKIEKIHDLMLLIKRFNYFTKIETYDLSYNDIFKYLYESNNKRIGLYKVVSKYDDIIWSITHIDNKPYSECSYLHDNGAKIQIHNLYANITNTLPEEINKRLTTSLNQEIVYENYQTTKLLNSINDVYIMSKL